MSYSSEQREYRIIAYICNSQSIFTLSDWFRWRFRDG